MATPGDIGTGGNLARDKSIRKGLIMSGRLASAGGVLRPPTTGSRPIVIPPMPARRSGCTRSPLRLPPSPSTRGRGGHGVAHHLLPQLFSQGICLGLVVRVLGGHDGISSLVKKMFKRRLGITTSTAERASNNRQLRLGLSPWTGFHQQGRQT